MFFKFQVKCKDASVGVAWCESKTVGCPVTCRENEQPCWNSNTNKDECKPLAVACPVECAASEKTCKLTDEMTGKAMEFCVPSTEECPKDCFSQGMKSCFDAAGKETCSPKGVPCPIACGPDQVGSAVELTLTNCCLFYVVKQQANVFLFFRCCILICVHVFQISGEMQRRIGGCGMVRVEDCRLSGHMQRE